MLFCKAKTYSLTSSASHRIREHVKVQTTRMHMQVNFSLALCYFVLVFFSLFCISITSLGEERANLSAFRTFIRFALVWFCLFPLPLGVWEGLRLVIVALPGLFSYLF